jgi:Flp pilus assembly protein TadD
MSEAYNNLGVIWFAGGEQARAESAFRQAIRIQPDYADAHCNLGNLLSGDGGMAHAGLTTFSACIVKRLTIHYKHVTA